MGGGLNAPRGDDSQDAEGEGIPVSIADADAVREIVAVLRHDLAIYERSQR